MQRDEGGYVGEKEDEQRQHKHAHETEHGVELLQPRRGVEAVGDALVELLDERPPHHVEHQDLRGESRAGGLEAGLIWVRAGEKMELSL